MMGGLTADSIQEDTGCETLYQIIFDNSKSNGWLRYLSIPHKSKVTCTADFHSFGEISNYRKIEEK